MVLRLGLYTVWRLTGCKCMWWGIYDQSGDISKIVDCCSNGKATGPDRIPIRSIRESKLIILPILVYLTNLVAKTSLFPDCLNIARAKPLFKKGDNNVWTNHRPISVIPPLAKIIEKTLQSNPDKVLASGLCQSEDFIRTRNLSGLTF